MKNLNPLLVVPFAALVVLGAVAPSAAFYLPDSDQRACFQPVDPYGVIPCAGTGQDGAYVVNPLSCTGNGNGTVTDNNTGLTWQIGEPGLMTWDAAWSYCDNLALAGRRDWRLPKIWELQSIVDYSRNSPPLVRSACFPNANKAYYLSSTGSAVSPSFKWNVSFWSGLTGAFANFKGYVRCVRGAQAGRSLVDNGDGTVTDAVTGLVWQQGETTQKTWAAALAHCESLTLGESSDWRLPNIRELLSLIDYRRSGPAIEKGKFPGAREGLYWSSTSHASYRDLAWHVDFAYGYADANGKGESNSVRCVRGGNDAFSDALDLKKVWKSGGAALWLPQKDVTHDGVDALRSGKIGHNKESWFETVIWGPKTLNFWWKTSAEDKDRLEFFIDGWKWGYSVGVTGWEQRSFQIQPGRHIVRWSFARDEAGSAELDAGFVDHIQITAPKP